MGSTWVLAKPTTGWCGHLGPKPNVSIAPTGQLGLACNTWGPLGAPLVAQALAQVCPPPPLWQNLVGLALAAFGGHATLMAMAQDHAHGLCTTHKRHSVPLGA